MAKKQGDYDKEDESIGKDLVRKKPSTIKKLQEMNLTENGVIVKKTGKLNPVQWLQLKGAQ